MRSFSFDKQGLHRFVKFFDCIRQAQSQLQQVPFLMAIACSTQALITQAPQSSWSFFVFLPILIRISFTSLSLRDSNRWSLGLWIADRSNSANSSNDFCQLLRINILHFTIRIGTYQRSSVILLAVFLITRVPIIHPSQQRKFHMLVSVVSPASNPLKLPWKIYSSFSSNNISLWHCRWFFSCLKQSPGTGKIAPLSAHRLIKILRNNVSVTIPLSASISLISKGFFINLTAFSFLRHTRTNKYYFCVLAIFSCTTLLIAHHRGDNRARLSTSAGDRIFYILTIEGQSDEI